MQLVYVADTGATIHCFKRPESCVNHAFRIFVSKAGRNIEKQVFSNSDGFHLASVDKFDKRKVVTYIQQMHIHTVLILSCTDKEDGTEKRITLRKTYLI